MYPFHYHRCREKAEKERRQEEEKRKREEADSAFEWWLQTKRDEDERKRQDSVNKKVEYLCRCISISSQSLNQVTLVVPLTLPSLQYENLGCKVYAH